MALVAGMRRGDHSCDRSHCFCSTVRVSAVTEPKIKGTLSLGLGQLEWYPKAHYSILNVHCSETQRKEIFRFVFVSSSTTNDE